MDKNYEGKISIFDMRKRTTTHVNVMKFLPNEEIEKIKSSYKGLGIEVSINRIIDPEPFVKKYFESIGYTGVFKLGMGSELRLGHYEHYDIKDPFTGEINYRYNKEPIYTSGVKKLLEKLETYDFDLRTIRNKDIPKDKIQQILRLLQCKGVPDYLAVKMKDDQLVDFMFIEVKAIQDAIRINQLKWIFSNNFPMVVVYVE